MINIEQTNESSLQKKSPGILSGLLTIVHVIIDLIMKSPKIFLRSREVTVCVVCVCVCVSLSSLKVHLNSLSQDL